MTDETINLNDDELDGPDDGTPHAPPPPPPPPPPLEPPEGDAGETLLDLDATIADLDAVRGGADITDTPVDLELADDDDVHGETIDAVPLFAETESLGGETINDPDQTLALEEGNTGELPEIAEPTVALGADDAGDAGVTIVDSEQTVDMPVRSAQDESCHFGSDPALPKPATVNMGATIQEDTDFSAFSESQLEETMQELAQTLSNTGQSDVDPGMTIKAEGEAEATQRMLRASARINVTSRRFTKTTVQKDVLPRVMSDAGTPSSSSADYEIVDTLGEGGMGVVYKARQTSIDRLIALKMIKSAGATNSDVREKFLTEAAVTGDLDHPNIVPIYDLGDNGEGALFYSMKYMKGVPWQDCIGEKTLDENLDILDDVSNALAFAHDRGVIHRDLKPENIMLGGYGEVMVMDWGLAAACSETGKAERIGKKAAICGTPSYMAPEMVIGDGARIGPCSDIYLLGAMLFQVLTGRPPHSGKDLMDCLQNAAMNKIVPAEVSDELSELLDVAMMAMATDPAERYATVKEFQGAINTYRSHVESINLAARAREDLSTARTTEDYNDFSKAVFGFQEAIALWDGNRDAEDGFAEASFEYAACALAKGDLDLADNQLIDGIRKHEKLRKKVAAEKLLRQKRQRRFKLAIGLVAVLVVLIIGGLSYFLAAIAEQKKEADQARAAAENAREEAVRDRKRAEEAMDEAKYERSVAMKAMDETKEANEQTKLALAEAEQARELAVTEQKAAEAAKLEAEKQREKAVKQSKIAEQRLNQLRIAQARENRMKDSSWWSFTPEEAKKRQAEAAERLEMPVERSVPLGSDTTAVFRLIPPGEFVMGSNPAIEKMREPNEILHPVKITQPFYMATVEFTREQWRAAFPGQSIPGSFKGRAVSPRHPIESVSWDRVVSEILPALQKYALEGYVFDLPTEAEWEYACRAGSFRAYWYGTDIAKLGEYAWSMENSRQTTQATGQKLANPWGLFDIHGNVAEWCLDAYDEAFYLHSMENEDIEAALNDPHCRDDESSLRVIRGGAWQFKPEHLRCAYRGSGRRSKDYSQVGFRLVLRKKP